jgi:D-arabinose 1-dehydrogenase-like Zn-dependent alcohol dehydrogenase
VANVRNRSEAHPRGLVTLHTSTYPLDAVNEAIQDLSSGNLQGRGILERLS